MDKISILEEISKEIIELQYDDSRRAEKLYSRVSVIVEKFFDSKVKYINELYAIRYLLKGINCSATGSDKEIKWQEGKEKLENLVNTLVYDVNISKKLTGGQIMSAFDNQSKCSKVFIVHGHDDGAKNEVARFIEKIGFEAVILHEQVDSGATIIEKLEKHTDVGFAIVLYTECDIGGVIKSKLEEFKPRARQNVIFEHGLLIGKIGRANVVALVKGNVEIPNDISGVVYKPMDTGGAWKYSIAREMKSSGYDVDMNKID
ncbi:nucleotide-binding protein [Psychrobacter sp. NZS113]|uniref:TIR domain-containing protein n=1 Tax=Psychrobacter sp. NZS113 TaxID=2792045 RepID=UPI0018CCDA81|nr:nucleotide-binding protein [Psychrobacter sp. NZS113]MBH0096931.1 nucleotide-binding protein [Psychrobacter sp. NZS113]